MKLRKRYENNIIIMYIEGKITVDSALFIEETGRIAESDYNKIVVNFKDTEIVDYNGLSVLAIAFKNITNKGGIMKFCNIPTHIHELLKLSRLDLVFDIHDSEKEALQSFQTSSKIDKLYLRRRFKRLDLHLSVKFIDSMHKKSKMSSGKVLNISGDGIYAYSKKTFTIDTRLNLEIELKKNNILRLQGNVIWLADKQLQPHCYPGMGIEFIDIANKNQVRIVDYIDKNISHRSNIN